MGNKGICSYSDKGEVSLPTALGLRGSTALGLHGGGGVGSSLGSRAGRGGQQLCPLPSPVPENTGSEGLRKNDGHIHFALAESPQEWKSGMNNTCKVEGLRDGQREDASLQWKLWVNTHQHCLSSGWGSG